MEATAYLGLGSNVGDRLDNLRRALLLLHKSAPIEVVSSIYETAPWGFLEQPPFLNAVCRVRTTLGPQRLLREMQRIERTLGRQRLQLWGPRTVDLDLLSYDDRLIESEDLTVPHPLLHERAFVLVPLAEIAPDWTHPRSGKRASELLARVNGREGVVLWQPAAAIWPPTG